MIVYKINLLDGFSYFGCNGLGSLEKLQNRDYSDVRNITFVKNIGNSNRFGDISIIDFSTLLVFSEKAKNVFYNFGNYIKLPNLENYELFEPRIIDALDYEESVIDYFKDSKDIKRIRKYIFQEKLISGVDAFVLPILPSPIFVTEAFTELYAKNNFEGLEFSKVYD